MNLLKKKGKRGALTDIFVFMIVGFILVISVVLFFFIGTTTYDSLIENAGAIQKILPDENAIDIIDDTFGAVPGAYESLKWITIMLLIGMMLSILVSGYLVTVKPVFFVPYILISIIAVIVSVPMSNVYEKVYTNSMLSSSFSGFWGQTYIFLNLHIWVTVICFLAGIIMFVNMVRLQEGLQ